MISAVVLAAERAESTKESKGAKPPLQYVLESAVASALDEIVCVTADLNSARRQIKLSDERLLWLLSAAADGRQSNPMIAGLWAIHPRSEGVMFLTAGPPPISSELINALIAKFRRSSALIVACGFKEMARNPFLFRRPLFPELLQLSGDRRTHALLTKYKNKTALIEWNEELSSELEDRETVEQARELT